MMLSHLLIPGLDHRILEHFITSFGNYIIACLKRYIKQTGERLSYFFLIVHLLEYL